MHIFKNRISRITIALGLSYSSCAFGSKPEQLEEKANLQEQLVSLRVATQQRASEQTNLIKIREQDQVSLQQEIQDLEQKKLGLEITLSEHKISLTEQAAKMQEHAIKPFDTVTFTSGRTVKCSVVSYENQQFKLEDVDGNSLHVFPRTVAGLRLRNEDDAGVFPNHIVNKGPRKLRTQDPNTLSTPAREDFDVKEHMVNVKIARSRSKSEIDTRRGYIDEVAEIIQYDCRIESKALPSDAKNLRLRVWVFAEGVTGRQPLKLILSENKTFDLPRLGEFEFETDSVTLQYDEKGGARYGFKLYGWLSVLEDANGNVITLKGNKRDLEDNLERIKKLSLNEEVQL